MAPGERPKRTRTAGQAQTSDGRSPEPLSRRHPPETVSPRWLLRAFLLTVGVAALCGYLTFCGLFLQGQWQLLLHPVRPGEALPAHLGSAAPERVRSGVDGSGQPQLTGLVLAGDPAGRFGHLTVLYLPSGDGSLASASARLAVLQRLGLSVVAFDYRGYGGSAARHPSQHTMEADSEQALRYVLQGRHIAPAQLLLYGEGVGGYLAARLAAEHPEIPAVVLEAPRFDLLQTVRRDPRVRLLPVRLLFHETFDLDPVLPVLATPKLLVWHGSDEPPEMKRAADPKMTAALPATDASAALELLARFLDQYVPAPPRSVLVTPRTP